MVLLLELSEESGRIIGVGATLALVLVSILFGDPKISDHNNFKVAVRCGIGGILSGIVAYATFPQLSSNAELGFSAAMGFTAGGTFYVAWRRIDWEHKKWTHLGIAVMITGFAAQLALSANFFLYSEPGSHPAMTGALRLILGLFVASIALVVVHAFGAARVILGERREHQRTAEG